MNNLRKAAILSICGIAALFILVVAKKDFFRGPLVLIYPSLITIMVFLQGYAATRTAKGGLRYVFWFICWIAVAIILTILRKPLGIDRFGGGSFLF